MSLELLMAVAGALLLLSVFANKISINTGLPSLLIFLILGMLAGVDGAGFKFDSAEATNNIGTLALAFILFSGGLETEWKSVKSVLFRGSVLSTIGVALTAFVMYGCCFYILKMDKTMSLLISVILSSTDAPAVFTLLRQNKLDLKNEKMKSLLEYESGSNDPMAVILSVCVLSMLTGTSMGTSEIIGSLLLQLGLGIASGVFFGKIAVLILKKWNFVYQGLYPVFGVSVICLTYSCTQMIHGNGYLALYISGMIIGNSSFPYHNPFVQFQSSLSWIWQIVMFLTLGLLVNPNELSSVFLNSLDLTVCLIFISRPIAVFICLIGSSYNFCEKIFISWAGLKGAVPIILATLPSMKGIEGAQGIFNRIFFIVLISLLFQGKTLAELAQFLGLIEKSSEEHSEKST
ncbi:MAG: potassium/proton antiporter [Alphaproteobacteria bacterium]|nr:potassium/proton antiporter [Alphaproteobacteria bacterium]